MPAGDVDVVRVVVLDECPLIRDGIKRVLEQSPHHVVVHTDATTRASRCRECHASSDLVVLGVRAGTPTGAGRLLAPLRARFPTARILAVSIDDDQAVCIDLVRQGVDGFVSTISPAVLLAALDGRGQRAGVFAGRAVTECLRRFAADCGARASAAARLSALSPREAEVARHVAAGHSTPVIATLLSVSEATVKACISSTLSKTGARNRVQIATLVTRALAGPPAVPDPVTLNR